MRLAKRAIALFMMLSVTTGSAYAVQTAPTQSVEVYETQSEVRNTSPKITKIVLPPEEEDRFFRIKTNFRLTYEEVLSSNESAVMYRSTNGGTFKKKLHSKRFAYSWGDVLTVYDSSVKNGNFYRYRLSTVVTDEETGKTTTVARSGIKSIYYLDPPTNVKIKDSSDGRTMTISWKRNSKADGYMVSYIPWQTGNTTYINRIVKGNKNTQFKLNNRTPGKQYTVVIRSYKVYKGKTYYSNYSKYVDRLN